MAKENDLKILSHKNVNLLTYHDVVTPLHADVTRRRHRPLILRGGIEDVTGLQAQGTGVTVEVFFAPA